MARPFKVLRNLMHENDFTQCMLADELGISQCSVSQRMNAHIPWDSEEMWKIMHVLHVPARRFHEVFPPKGDPALAEPIFNRMRKERKYEQKYSEEA